MHDFLNTPLNLFEDSELLSNPPNLAQEHKKIGPSQQNTIFFFENTFFMLFHKPLIPSAVLNVQLAPGNTC